MMHSPLKRRKRRGLTLVELLVVIAIIGVLAGMLLPAVQRAREAANRRSCSNKLAQLGLGLQQFHDVHLKFPPGQVKGPLPEAGVVQVVNHGWGPFVLPFIEQRPLADQYHWDVSVSAPLNQPVVSTQLELFQCPSARANRYFVDGPSSTYGGKSACGDYAPTWYVDAVLVGGDNRGILTPNCMTRMAEITDGASNTILLTEDAGRPALWLAGKKVPGSVDGGPWAAFKSGIILQGSSLDGVQRPGPCALNCTNDHEAYSFHPGGANAVFADRSVHFLNAEMNIQILAALVTRAGGEVVSDD